MANIEDARVHLADALSALTINVQNSDTGEEGTWREAPAIETTLAWELERIDRAIGPTGRTMFASIAERIKEAVIAVIAAQRALDGGSGQGTPVA